jgi:hypothetical protein
MVTDAFDRPSLMQSGELENKEGLENYPVTIVVAPILRGLEVQDVGEENTGVRTIAAESSVTTLILYPDGSYRHGDPEAVRTGCGWYL